MYPSILIVYTMLFISLIAYTFLDGGREEYRESSSYFPWNEANLVHKHVPASTVECRWCLANDEFQSPWMRRKYATRFYG